MINVDKNPNFTNWFDIRLFGKLVDNATSYANAMRIARKLSEQTKSPIIATKTKS